MRSRFLIVASALLLLAIAKPGFAQWNPFAPPPPKWTASISLIRDDAHAYCPPPCTSTGTTSPAAAQNSAQILIQRITSGQLTIEQARTMAGRHL